MAGTLANLRPFVDSIVCMAEHLPEVVASVAREYGAQVFKISAGIAESDPLRQAIPGEWVLNVWAGERPDEIGLEELKPLLESLPPDMAGVSLRAVFHAPQGPALRQPTEVRVLRRGKL